MKKYLNFILAGLLIIALIAIMVLIKNGNIAGYDNAGYNLVTSTTNGFLDNMYKVFTFFLQPNIIEANCASFLFFTIHYMTQTSVEKREFCLIFPRKVIHNQ